MFSKLLLLQFDINIFAFLDSATTQTQPNAKITAHATPNGKVKAEILISTRITTKTYPAEFKVLELPLTMSHRPDSPQHQGNGPDHLTPAHQDKRNFLC